MIVEMTNDFLHTTPVCEGNIDNMTHLGSKPKPVN